MINTKVKLFRTMSEPFESSPNLSSSSMSQKAWRDLESLGYDINALMQMNMNEQQVVELRNKAFRYRGLTIPDL
ncbi:MAG: hypothetical protein HMLIMOIP_001306 [Candidatus Nitrosomirales archaeon]|jgi:hypothetical protein